MARISSPAGPLHHGGSQAPVCQSYVNKYAEPCLSKGLSADRDDIEGIQGNHLHVPSLMLTITTSCNDSWSFQDEVVARMHTSKIGMYQ